MAFPKKFRVPIFPLTLERFLGLCTLDLDAMIFHACHIFAVRNAVNHSHRSQRIVESVAVESIIWQGHRTAVLQHSGLRKRYREIWCVT